jgi:hypothetical protein
VSLKQWIRNLGKTKYNNIVNLCMKHFNDNKKNHYIYVESVKHYSEPGFT